MAAADTRARSSRRQLPITGSAHKAGNGRRPLPAATGTARSAKDLRRGTGWPPERAPICCRWRISTSFSPCRPRSREIAYWNKKAVYDLLFRGIGRDADHDRGRSQAPRRTHRHDQRAAHLGIGADASPACPHASCRAVACRRTARGGSAAAPASSCPCGSCPGCSGVCFWKV